MQCHEERNTLEKNMPNCLISECPLKIIKSCTFLNHLFFFLNSLKDIKIRITPNVNTLQKDKKLTECLNNFPIELATIRTKG